VGDAVSGVDGRTPERRTARIGYATIEEDGGVSWVKGDAPVLELSRKRMDVTIVKDLPEPTNVEKKITIARAQDGPDLLSEEEIELEGGAVAEEAGADRRTR